MENSQQTKRIIGVFDSGMGGLSVAQAIQHALPDDEVLLATDSEHVPYGTRSPQEILGFVEPILQGLVDLKCEVIVIACNTVTTTLIDQLRQNFTAPLIGMEPMVKPAAKLTKSGIITVCATPTTLASKRYQWLKDTYAPAIRILEPDCSDWTSMIEENHIDQQKIRTRISETCQQGADVIVLGCTHYHWIEDLITTIAAGRATVLQPEQPVIEQLKRVLEQPA